MAATVVHPRGCSLHVCTHISPSTTIVIPLTVIITLHIHINALQQSTIPGTTHHHTINIITNFRSLSTLCLPLPSHLSSLNPEKFSTPLHPQIWSTPASSTFNHAMPKYHPLKGVNVTPYRNSRPSQWAGQAIWCITSLCLLCYHGANAREI